VLLLAAAAIAVLWITPQFSGSPASFGDLTRLTHDSGLTTQRPSPMMVRLSSMPLIVRVANLTCGFSERGRSIPSALRLIRPTITNRLCHLMGGG